LRGSGRHGSITISESGIAQRKEDKMELAILQRQGYVGRIGRAVAKATDSMDSDAKISEISRTQWSFGHMLGVPSSKLFARGWIVSSGNLVVK
jgi:hypothetical protein